MSGTPRPPARPNAPRVLYLAYWGALEPLGQSLVLPAVERLASRVPWLGLVTFEKPADLAAPGRMAATRSRLDAGQIAWRPLRYHRVPRVPATAFDMAHGWARGVALGRSARVQVVHGRTFVGGLIGRAVATTLRVPYVFHNEGFYPDEMVDGGFWRPGSATHRVARLLEYRLYASADGIIVLSSRAALRVEGLSPVRRRRSPVIVVPSCVDLDRFVPVPRGRHSAAPLRLVYSGAVGGRYQLDRIGRLVAVFAERRPVRLSVLTRESPALVSTMLHAGGLEDGLWEVDFVAHAGMPEALTRHHAGLFFLARGSSELGCSPTKIGEYWACGLPVVTTPGVSDTDDLIARFRCGVIVQDHSEEAYRRAGDELVELLADPGLSVRCRAAAEHHYALGPACQRQADLYEQVTRGR